jgi:hypothetical protein
VTKKQAKAKTQPRFKKVSLHSWRNLGRSTKWLWQNFGKLMLITAIVAIPVGLLRSSSADYSILGSVAGLFLLIALTIVSLDTKAMAKSLAQIYNQASANYLRMIGVMLLLTVVFVPAMMGLSMAILIIGQQISLWPLLGAFSLLVSVFFSYLLVRLSLTGIALIDMNLSVAAAARLSLRLSKKRFWRLLGSYTLVLFVLFFVSGLSIQLLLLIPFVQTSDVVVNLINGVLLTLLVPVLIRYVVSNYQAIQKA